MKNKKKTIIIIISIVIVIGIVLCIVLLNNKPDKKKSTKSKTFEDVVEKRLKDGTLKKELNKSLPYDDQLTKNTEVKMKEMDIDSDNETELVAYTKTNTKYLIYLEVNIKKEEVKSVMGYGVDGEKVLGYAYSKNDDKDYWFIYSNGDNTKSIIKKDEKPQFISNDEFNKDYYVIEDSVIDDFIDVDLDKNELDKDKLKESNTTNEEVLEENDLTQEQVKEKANEVKEEEQPVEETKKEETQPVTNVVVINGHTIPTNKKCKETANPLYDGLELHSDGTCVIGNEKCIWSNVTYDFGQDSSSTGTKTPCIVVNHSSGIIYISSWQDNVLSDGGTWTCEF